MSKWHTHAPLPPPLIPLRSVVRVADLKDRSQVRAQLQAESVLSLSQKPLTLLHHLCALDQMMLPFAFRYTISPFQSSKKCILALIFTRECGGSRYI